jgi:CheY-like chemotaxis protein
MKTDQEFILIDDNPIDLFIHKMIINKVITNPKYFPFTSAKQGLEFIEKNYNKQTQHKSILLLDMEMPVMNGKEFLAHFDKLDTSIKDQIKIIIISYIFMSEQEKKDIMKRYPSVYRFLSKPLTEENIPELIGLN